MITSEEWGGKYHLKSSAKEDIHYKVVDDKTWKFLFDRYGGNDLPRMSIGVQSQNDQVDHIVEISLRRFTALTYPRVKYI